MFDPKKFGFEKWNIGERYNLFIINNEIVSLTVSNFKALLVVSHSEKDCKIYHLTQKDNKVWMIELIEKNKDEILYQGYILNNKFALELFNNFEKKIPGLHDIKI